MDRSSNRTLLYVGAGAALAALLLAKKDKVMIYGAKALEAGYEVYFKAVISDEAKPYASIILQVAREKNVDPFLIYALGQRESRWGEALDADLTGDSGHGHGIMQVDDRSFASWLAANDWRDPLTNVRKGIDILKGKMAFFTTRSAVRGYTDGTWVLIDKSAARLGVSPGQYRDPRPLQGDALAQAAIASFNTGEANVLMNLAAGRPAEFTTAGGDYVSDVWAKMSDAAASFQQQAGV